MSTSNAKKSRMALYTATIGAAIAPGANSAPITVTNPFLVTNSPVAWDIDNDGFAEANISANSFPDIALADLNASNRIYGVGAASSAGLARAIPTGETIGGVQNLPMASQGLRMMYSGYGASTQYGSTDAIGAGQNNIGFAFQMDPSGPFHFGWANITVNNLGNPNGSIQFNEWTYESIAGAPLVVTGAATSAVPAPASLLLLASGAAGLAGLRRRRKAELANHDGVTATA